MTRFKRTLLYTVVAGLMLAAGCHQTNMMSKNREDARQRWASSRAELATKLGQGCFNRGEFDRAREHIDGLVRQNVAYAPLYVLAARLAAEKGDLDVALSYAQAAREIDPEDAEARYVLGTMEQTVGHPDRALEEYGEAAALDPSQSRYVLAQAEMLVSQGDADRALEVLQESSDRLGSRPEFQAARGDVLSALKRYGEAVGSYRIALRLGPDQADVKERLARALFHSGAYREAESALADLTVRPGAEEISGWIVRMRIDCLLALGRTAQARDLLTTLAKSEPTASGPWIGLAQCDILDQQLPKARQNLELALAKDPRDSQANALLGFVLVATDHAGEAVPHLELALKDPKLSDREAVEKLLAHARSSL
jgi:tetratricopeptide (TPR) repeat protein